MLTVSPAAGQYILGILQKRNIPATVAARLNVDFGDLQVKLEQALPGDVTIAFAGRTIILLDAATAQSLSNHTIDLVASPVGSELVLRSLGGSPTG
jgi:hypothetical protein